MNLFCEFVGNYIGWELLSIGNLFCWYQLVGNLFCFEQRGITSYVLGRNVYRRKKNFFKKKLLPITTFFKTRLQENQRSRPWVAFLNKTRLQALSYSCVFHNNAAQTGSIAAFFYKNAAIDLSLCVVKMKGWELQPCVIKKRSYRPYLGCVFLKNAAIGHPIAAFLQKTQLQV